MKMLPCEPTGQRGLSSQNVKYWEQDCVGLSQPHECQEQEPGYVHEARGPEELIEYPQSQGLEKLSTSLVE